MRDTADAEHPLDDPHEREMAAAMARAGMLHDLPPSISSIVSDADRSGHKWATRLKMHDGSTRLIELAHHFKDQYRDEYTGETLPSDWIKEAIFDEIHYFNTHVWTGIPAEVARSDPEAKIIGTRWVLNNKGDIHNPDVRARLVAQEVGDGPDSAFYAATPPLESKRLLLSQWATERERNGQCLKLSFIDVRKAYFHGRPTSKLFVRLPKEMGMPAGYVARLERAMYGTRP